MHALGRYEVVRRLGGGGFATVFQCHDPVLDSSVAVKVLADHWAQDAEIRGRFIREARLLRRLERNRLLPIYDIGEEAGGRRTS